jgi:SAM-dependent methyltransferase
MKAAIQQIIIGNRTWFEHWFDTDFYHKLYSHRNEKEAADLVKLLVYELKPNPQASMLDLGCGAGRHARQCAAMGFDVTGLDLSFSSIHQAKKWETKNLHFYKQDMRNAFGVRCFDYVFNFFTSFGYFHSDDENTLVVQNMAAALKSKGWLLLDYINVDHAEKNLVPREEKVIDGISYKICRWYDSDHIHKRIEVFLGEAEQPYVYTEKVVRFREADFQQLFHQHGLQLKRVFGDYQLNEFNENSPRLMMLAQKVA